MKRCILFVCRANQFRSPLAAACFRRRMQQVCPHEEWLVASAGTWALEGQPAAPLAQAVAAQYGLSLKAHRSRRVSPDLLRDCTLVVVMEAGQKEALLAEFPWLEGRVHLLTALAGEPPLDVPDIPPGEDEAAALALGQEVCHLAEAAAGGVCGNRGGAATFPG